MNSFTKFHKPAQNFSIISALLSIILIFSGCSSDKPVKKENKITVGVFNGNGSSIVCVTETMEALKIDKEINPVEISSYDIMNGMLEKLDALIFPGGSGSQEYNNLGLQAAEKVRDFVYKDGGGIIGICAGGFVLSTTPGYPSLEILPAPDIRDGYYDRGRGLIAFNLNDKGNEIFPELSEHDSLFVQYYDGPIFNTTNSSGLDVLGNFYSDIATHTGYPKGTTPGKAVFTTSSYGNGKVFMSVGHPEATPGMRWMVPRMARWVTGNKLVPYSKNIVRPEINNKEILYYDDVIKFEKKNFWNLFNEEDSLVIKSLQNLHSIRSRPSIRWSIGLLRHQSWDVRHAAANYLLESEYTYAIPDIEAAIETEKDETNRNKLKEILSSLRSLSCQVKDEMSAIY